MKPLVIILEGKVISSILKDFLAWHVLPIQINIGQVISTKESTMLGIIELAFREIRVDAMVST